MTDESIEVTVGSDDESQRFEVTGKGTLDPRLIAMLEKNRTFIHVARGTQVGRTPVKGESAPKILVLHTGKRNVPVQTVLQIVKEYHKAVFGE